MTDKTCGTCAYAESPLINCVRMQAGNRVACGLYANNDPACGWYVERTDSVERIALDMLALIKAARTRPIVLDPNKMPGGQILKPLPETEFADRLRALGIEVPE